MHDQRIKYLLKQYAADKSTADELAELFSLIKLPEADSVLKQLIAEEAKAGDVQKTGTDKDWEKIWLAIRSETTDKQSFSRRMIYRWQAAAAAVLLVAMAGAAYWFSIVNPKQQRVASMPPKQYITNIVPGGNKAILQLADGTRIVLDTAKNGSLTRQGNVQIVKLDAGQLAYNTGGENTAVVYNTISTPRGGQFEITLQDGTKVWLNSGSSLYFPTAFKGKERRVVLTGEGYFEVAKNASMPFHVTINGADVSVLGTHFNIMGYTNENASKTTLLEGKVNVEQDGRVHQLEPGKEAIINNNTHTVKIADANIAQAIAWKNGFFRFKNTGIKEVMRQVERWYNVEVTYKSEGKEQDFTGVISRSDNVSALLQTLEMTGTVHFQIEQSSINGTAGKIIVLP